MRASPACQVSLQRFGAWRGGVIVLAGAGAGALVAWLASRPAPVAPMLIGAVGVALLATAALAVSLWRVPSRELRWDGQVWQLGERSRPPSSTDPSAQPGTLSPAIDLGPWMLLRFTPQGSTRAIWLPVQRRGLEAQWHALRCAIYSPAPATEP